MYKILHFKNCNWIKLGYIEYQICAIVTFLFPAVEFPPAAEACPELAAFDEFFFEPCLLVLLLLPVEPCCDDENGSEDAPPVALVLALIVVVLPAARDDGVNDPAIEAFGVMLGPPPEVVEGEAWDPGEDESILACIAETYK